MEDFEFQFSQGDLDRTKPMVPGWYPAKVSKIEKKPAKDGSMNANVHFAFTGSDATGRTRFKSFNEKDNAKVFAIPFFKACNNGKDLAPGQSYNIFATEGKELEVYVKNREYEGRIIDEITDFRPLS